MKNRKLAKIVKQCRDIPGKELFQYVDDTGNTHSVDSGKVNNYIKAVGGGEFSAKDFRTWAGSLNAIRAFKSCEPCETKKSVKSTILEVLDCVSKKLGNTRNVCKKYYVHPRIIELFENKKLNQFLMDGEEIKSDEKSSLEQDEIILMKILQAA